MLKVSAAGHHCLTWPVLGEPAQPWGGSTLARWSGGGCPWGAWLVDGGRALAPLAEQVLRLGDNSEQTPQGVKQHLQQQPSSQGEHATGHCRLITAAKGLCRLPQSDVWSQGLQPPAPQVVKGVSLHDMPAQQKKSSCTRMQEWMLTASFGCTVSAAAAPPLGNANFQRRGECCAGCLELPADLPEGRRWCPGRGAYSSSPYT